MRTTRERHAGDAGFTLIELLVVIIIIGILAAIAIPVFLNQRKAGYQASMKSDLRTAANEMESYFADNTTYVGAMAGPITGPQQAVGADYMSLSQFNTIRPVTATSSSYCLQATSTMTAKIYHYDSAKGGLGNGPCS